MPDVKLQAVLMNMQADGHDAFITIGTDAQLGKQVERLVAASPQMTTFPFDLRIETQAASLARLYCSGAEFDWRPLYAEQERRRISLPTYAFARQSYFLRANDRKQGNR